MPWSALGDAGLVLITGRGGSTVSTGGAVVVHRGGGLVVLWFATKIFHRRLGSSFFDEGFLLWGYKCTPAGEMFFFAGGQFACV